MNLFFNLQDFATQHKRTINTICFSIVLVFAMRARFYDFGKVSLLLLLSYLALAVILTWSSLKEILLVHQRFLFFLLILFIWMWASAFLSEFPATATGFSRNYSHYFILFLCFLLLTYKNNNKNFYRLIFYFLELLGVLGIIQYFYPKLEIFAISFSLYPRISSVMQHPNPFAIAMSIAAILTLGLYHYQLISRLELYVGEAIFIITSAFAGSRNELVIFSLGLLFLLILKYINLKSYLQINFLKILAIVISPSSSSRIASAVRYFLAPITGLKKQNTTPIPKQGIPKLAPPTDIAIQGRFELWNAAIHEITRRPITGIGVGVFSEHVGTQVFLGRHGYHTHNLFLNVLVELGIPGLLLLLTLIYILVRKIRFNNVLVSVPLIMFLASQLVDLFIDNVIFTTIEVYFLAAAINSSNEANKKINPMPST